ncbi:carbonic anhydrase [Lophiotrema nucula]|uniref:Carbonic anhydrase n=1 Tax=Lophiotrema nucula TaxID=690887 RepID=A0A6A5ZY52_9PLEO|nr:carbonic anhydrase [Lophiotrema nucula]
MVSGQLVEMLARNSKIAETYQAPPKLVELLPKIRAAPDGVLVISCCDPRVFPEKILGLDAGLQAIHIRNAGGRVFDEIRTLAVMQTLGSAKTIVVMHHTDCGMTHVHDDDVKKALREIAPAEEAKIEAMKFGEITGLIEDSVRGDVGLLKASPLIKKETQIVGLKLDLFSGKLEVVA